MTKAYEKQKKRLHVMMENGFPREMAEMKLKEELIRRKDYAKHSVKDGETDETELIQKPKDYIVKSSGFNRRLLLLRHTA